MQVVITCYFNPSKCQYRLRNYHKFYQYLKNINISVYTIELVFGKDNFELTTKDANWLKQLRSNDIMFQKERMLNIALENLPPVYDQVIWLDCDLFFFEDDWISNVAKSLKKYKVTQPYSLCIALPKCEISDLDKWQTIYYDVWGSGRIKRSFSYYYSKRKTFPNLHHGHLGYAWAARRDFLEKHKFYDVVITGAGDLFMAMAFSGSFGWLDYPKEINNYPEEASRHYFDWAFPVYEDTKGDIGYTNDVVFHMWHGDINNRNYLSCSESLQLNNFNPCKDLRISSNGTFEWTTENSQLHTDVEKLLKSQ